MSAVFRDVEVPVAVEVGRDRLVHAREARERARLEAQLALVLEPRDRVVRLQDVVVEHVAVGDEEVVVAVLVEIDDGEAGRAPVRMRRLVEHLRAKGALAVAEVGEELLVLLRDERERVKLLVDVEVEGARRTPNRATVEHQANEGPETSSQTNRSALP